jgi:hypothetical protein
MKYTQSPFKIDAAYDAALQNKKIRFIEATETQKAIHLTMVTSQGLVRNAFSDDIQCQIIGDELFEE